MGGATACLTYPYFCAAPFKRRRLRTVATSFPTTSSCFLSCKISHSILSSVHLASVSAAWAALAPSSVAASVGKYKQEQVDHPIFDGRPMATLSIFWVFPLIILLGHKERSNWKPTEADAVVRGPIEHESFVNKTVVLACVELKNELGIRGDGGLQAALSLRRYVAQEHVNLLCHHSQPSASLT